MIMAVMDADEFNAALAKLFPDAKGKGQSEAARFLGISDRTVRDYVAKGAPDPAAKLLRTMLALGLTPAEIDAALAGLVKTAARPKRRKP